MAVIGDDNIIKVTKYNINRCSVSVPSWNNNDSNYRQIGSQTMTVSPVAANSKFIIDINIMMFNVSSHGYITLKRGGTSGLGYIEMKLLIQMLYLLTIPIALQNTGMLDLGIWILQAKTILMI